MYALLMVDVEPRRPLHGARCKCRTCTKRLEYSRRWQARVTRMYRWALAHASAERAWASKRTLHRHAHTLAVAYAREFGLTGQARRDALKAWAEIYFDAPADSEGTWEWTRS